MMITTVQGLLCHEWASTRNDKWEENDGKHNQSSKVFHLYWWLVLDVPRTQWGIQVLAATDNTDTACGHIAQCYHKTLVAVFF